MSFEVSPSYARPTELPWARLLLSASGAIGVVVAISLSVTSQPTSSAMFASQALRTSVLTPAVGQATFVRQAQPTKRSSRHESSVAAARPSFDDAATSVPSTDATPYTIGMVAMLSTLFGAVVMKLWGDRTRSESAPIAMASIAGQPAMGFEHAGLSPARPSGRGGHTALQAAKKPAAAGKGKGAGGGKGKVAGIIKLALPAGKATPAPPVGPALGQYGLNIVAFCKEYNALTEKEAAEGMIIPVEITAFEDRTFTFVLKTPPASVLLRKAAKVEKGSANPKKDMVGAITEAQLEQIAKTKLPDLNTTDLKAAMRIIEGTAKNMGVAIQR